MGDWYDRSGVPANNASLSSSAVRGELGLIETAMAKLPTLTGNGSKIVRVNSAGTALESVSLQSAGVPLTGSAAKSSAYPVVLTDKGKALFVTGTTTITLVEISTTSDGFTVGVKNVGTAIVTCAPYAGDTISGVATSVTLYPGESEIYYSNGTTWYRMSQAYGNDYTSGSTVFEEYISNYSQSPAASAYTKVGSDYTVYRGGTISTTIELDDTDSSQLGANTLYARVYVNGSAVGTERSITVGQSNSWDENITVTRGDSVQFYVKCDLDDISTVIAHNFYLKSGLTEYAHRFGYSDYIQADNTGL